MNRSPLRLSIATVALLQALPAQAQAPCDWSLELAPGNGVDLFGADHDFVGGVWIAGSSRTTAFPFRDLNFVARWNGGQWVQADTPQPSSPTKDQSLYGIAALGPDDAIAVGARDSLDGNFSVPQSMRWNGASWELLDTPQEIEDNGNGSGFFQDVSRTGDTVWAVGRMPSIVPGGAGEPLNRMFATRLDGGQWTFELLPLFDGIQDQGLASYRSQAIAGTAADDVWVGGWVLQVGPGPDGALLAHWDGSEWNWHDIWPLMNTDVSDIEAIAAIASDDVWAVGDETFDNQTRAVILHFDGTAWSRIAAPNEPNLNVALRTVVARSADDVYAGGVAWVSGKAPQAYLVHFDGDGWSVVPDVEVAAESQFFASAIADDDTLWMAGLSNEFLDGLAQRAELCGPGGGQPLVGAPPELSVAAGGVQAWSLDAGADQAGRFYVVLGSASGTQPGIALDGLVLPLVADSYTSFSLVGANQPPFHLSFGLLDGAGRAAASVSLPAGAGAGLAGLELHHAYPVLDPVTGSVTFVSNAAGLQLVP